MKMSNRMLLTAYAVVVIALSVLVFTSRGIVEKVMLGPGNQSFLVK